MTAMQAARRDDPAFRGFLFALAANLIWGVLPVYMRSLSHVPGTEIVAHRIIWSIPIAGALLLWLGRTADVRIALRTPRTLAFAVLTAALVTVNWGIYVWAVTHDAALEAALGYYISPLLSVLLGALVLRERLGRAQTAAIGLAAVAVAVLSVETGGLPWASLSLAASWAIYALLKKTLPIDPAQGFFLEILILGLPALGYLVFLQARGEAHFVVGTADAWLLAGCGLATAAPLILFANGAKLLKVSTMGMMQYLAPTMVFLIAVFVFDEPFGSARAIAFVLIWIALLIYSWSVYFAPRR